MCPPVSRYWESFATWWNSLKYSKLNPLAEHNIILGFPVETNKDIIIVYILPNIIYIVLTKIKKLLIFLKFLAI